MRTGFALQFASLLHSFQIVVNRLDEWGLLNSNVIGQSDDPAVWPNRHGF